MAKRNSPSDKRQKERTAANKARNIARAPKPSEKAWGQNRRRISGEYGRPDKKWEKPRVVFDKPVPQKWQGWEVHALIVEGVITEWSVNRIDIDNAKRETSSHLAYQHVTISPYGNRTLVESRRGN